VNEESPDVDKRHVSRIAVELDLAPVSEDWSGVDAVWPLLEKMRSEGAVVLVKLDGERAPSAGPYTAHVSLGGLGRNHFRTDARTVEDALVYVIANYAAEVWGIPAWG
jgi:hypothetical protein